MPQSLFFSAVRNTLLEDGAPVWGWGAFLEPEYLRVRVSADRCPARREQLAFYEIGSSKGRDRLQKGNRIKNFIAMQFTTRVLQYY